MTDKTREDFEAWAKSKGAPKEGWWIRQIDDGGYSCGPVDDAWNGYQAATQRSAARIAELEAEVQALRDSLPEMTRKAAKWDAINAVWQHKDAKLEDLVAAILRQRIEAGKAKP